MTSNNLQLITLGGVELRSTDGKKLKFPTKKAHAVLIYLVLSPSQSRSREHLADIFWRRSAEEQARASLRQTLSALRKLLNTGESDCISSSTDSISVNPESIDIDAQTFEKLAEKAEIGFWLQAKQLYQGEFLLGFNLKEEGFEQWVSFERNRYRELASRMYADIASHYEAVSEYQFGIQACEDLLELEPFSESTHRCLMRLFAKSGRRDAALKQYENCKNLLISELGVEPDEQTLQVYEEIQKGSVLTAESSRQVRDEVSSSVIADATQKGVQPSVAVLPFSNMIDDPEQEMFADGLTEDLVSCIARDRWLTVISHKSTQRLNDRTLGLSDIAKRLNVRYIVTGTVRKLEKQVRVSVQLIDAQSGTQIWSDHYKKKTSEFFQLQDKIATTIAGAIIPELSRSERQSLMRQHPKDLDAWGFCHKGFWHLYTFSITEFSKAEEQFQKAIELDSGFAQAWAGLAHTQMLICWYDESRRDIIHSAEENIRRSMELDATAPYSYFVLGRIMGAKPDYEKAIQAYETAIELNPSFAQAHFGLASIMLFSNQSELAIAPIEKALKLSPHDPQLWTFLHIKSRSLLMLDRKEEALKTAEKMVAQSNAPYFAYQTLAAILGHMGKLKEAKAAVDEVLKVKPEYTIENYVDDSFSIDKAVTDHFLVGLRKAGLPANRNQVTEIQDTPSIAVLPFVNMSSDEDQEYFSDGITEEVINGLSRVKAFFVVARNSVFGLKNLNLEIDDIGERLGARYLVTGSVRKSGNRVRISVSLIDVQFERQLWNDQYDGTLDDIFELQDEITSNVVSAVEPKIRKAEIERALARRSDNLHAYDYFLRALPEIYAMTRKGTSAGLELLQQAMEIDPNYHRAQSMAAWCCTLRRAQGMTTKGSPEDEYAIKLARSALRHSDDDPEVLWQAGYAAGFFTFAFEDFLSYIDRSIEINPNSAYAWVVSGMARLFGGDPQSAIPHLETGLKLSPSDPLSFRPQMALAQAYMCLEKHEEAVDWARRAMQTGTFAHPAMRVMAASLAHLGRLDEAKKVVNEILQVFPDSSIELLQNTTVQQNQRYRDIYVDGVRLAGLPEY